MERAAHFGLLLLALTLTASAARAEDNLVGHWTFDQTLKDGVAGGNGAITGNTDGAPIYAAGYDGQEHGAIHFDGRYYITVPRLVQDELTIACWVRLEAAQASTGDERAFYMGAGLVQGERDGETNDAGLAVLRTVPAWGCGAPDFTIEGQTSIITGDWLHVAAVRDLDRERGAAELRLYVDGKLAAWGAHEFTGSLTAHDSWAVGGHLHGDRLLVGELDDLRFYNGPLSEREIRALAQRPPEPPVERQPQLEPLPPLEPAAGENVKTSSSAMSPKPVEPAAESGAAASAMEIDRLPPVSSIAQKSSADSSGSVVPYVWAASATAAGLAATIFSLYLLARLRRMRRDEVRWIVALERRSPGIGPANGGALKVGLSVRELPRSAARLEPDPRAASAPVGIQAGNVLLQIKGREVQAFGNAEARIRKANSGDAFDIQFRGRDCAVAEAGQLPAADAGECGARQEQQSAVARDVAAESPPVLGVFCEPDEEHPGKIVDVLPDSPAAQAGIVPGDVLLEVAGSKAESFEALSECLKNLPPGRKFEVLLARADGRRQRLNIVFPRNNWDAGVVRP